MRTILIALVLIPAISTAVAEPREIGFQGYTSRLWEAQDGLPDQTAQTFAQTQDGSLWIGTKGGLLRFDGARFIVYNRDIAPSVLERGVNCLQVSRDGSLWIGTEGGGVVRFRNQRFQVSPTIEGLSNEFVRAIHESKDGSIWVGADQGLFRVTGSSLMRIDGSHGIPSIFVRAIASDKQGHTWVGGTTLLEFAGNSFLREYPLPGGPSVNLITSLYSAHDGTFWVGTLSGMYRVMPSGALSRLPGISAQVSVLKETLDGTLWVGTIGQGLFYRRRQSFFHVASANLPSQTVNAVFEDSEKNVWLGTQAGVIRLSSTPVSIVPFPGGADSEFETLFSDAHGTIWVAASTHIFKIRDGIASLYTFAGLPRLRVRTLLRDRRGDLWIGTDGAGLLHIVGNHIERFHAGHGLINDFVRAILASDDGSIWVGTDGGVTHLEPGRSQNYDVGNGLAYFSITALFEDHDGDIWVGTSRGLTHLSHEKIVHDAATEALRQEQLWSICQDSSGKIWFGTSNGLYGLEAGKLIHLTTAQGLASNIIYQVLDDSRGNVWLGSPNSISRLRLSDLDRFQNDSRIALTFYEDSTDLNSAALYSGLQPEGAVSSNGDVWFPSNKGAIHIAANRIVPASSSPVRLDEATADGQPLPLDATIVLHPGNTRLEVSYAVIHLGSQEGFRFRYKMEGLESWNEVFTRRTAYYTHLPPGTYRFRVQAYEIGNPGAISEASILVIQKPYFYSTAWFLTGCVLALLSAVFLMYRLRLRQMRVRFQAVSEERARLAREMHDTVIQGCVGVSTLLEAASGIETSEEPLRDQLLNYATEQIRATIETAREAVSALRHASTSAADVGLLCEELARRMQADSGIPVRCRVTGDAFQFGDPATHELMMAVKEALANAVSHARPNCIDIDVCFTKRDLKIEVCDDGCGFDLSASRARDGHYGILGMQERVRLLHGTLSIESKLERGTTVRIVIPRRRRIVERIWVGKNASKSTDKNEGIGSR